MVTSVILILAAVGLATKALSLFGARMEYREDFRVIQQRLQYDDDRELNHGPLLAMRVFMLIVLLAGWCVPLAWVGSSLWLLVPVAGIAMFSFIMRHRYGLNKLRGKKWWYMGPSLDDRKKGSARYDAMFHWIVFQLWGWRGSVTKTRYYHQESVGALAYTVESVLLAASWIYYITQWPWKP